MRRFAQEATLQKACLILILLVAAALRSYGLNWDDGHWLHPDERQIYFVAEDLAWPSSLIEALGPDSPLNPKFFAYGSLPIYLVRFVAAVLASFWPAVRDLGNLHLVGRPLAALFDLGTIYLTYLLALKLWRPRADLGKAPAVYSAQGQARWGALLAAAFVSLAVLHVQLAHFYTADPLLIFFIMLTLNLAADVAQGAGRGRQLALGMALGLAMATKISAAPLVLAIFAMYYVREATFTPKASKLGARLLTTVRHMLPTLVIAVAVFILTQPYALIDWQTFLGDTTHESQIAWGIIDVPYTRQYTGTLPYLYSIWQTAFWGMGLALGLVAWTALAFTGVRWLRRGDWTDTLLLAWTAPYLALTGMFYARHLRYMLPLVPLLCIMTARLLLDLKSHRDFGLRRKILGTPCRYGVGYWVLVVFTLAWSLIFVNIYGEPHSWVRASEWIYEYLPEGRVLIVEEWDRTLPLPLELDGQSRRKEEFDVRKLPFYDEPDNAAKWEPLAADIAASDYVILASRRLYGSIPRLPERYPVTTRYYNLLFNSGLGFELVGEFTRGPAWLNPRIPPFPDAAPALLRPDESFVVYDHPRALIFRNAERLSPDELLQHLGIHP